MPLTIAVDIAKRLHHELARHMTPEQLRDFARVERLINEAQTNHKTELARMRQNTGPKPVGRRKSLFGR